MKVLPGCVPQSLPSFMRVKFVVFARKGGNDLQYLSFVTACNRPCSQVADELASAEVAGDTVTPRHRLHLPPGPRLQVSQDTVQWSRDLRLESRQNLEPLVNFVLHQAPKAAARDAIAPQVLHSGT